MTALGAATVFLAKDISRKFLDLMLGFAAGVMMAAIFWSMLKPSIEIAASRNMIPWLPASVGFLAGGLFLRILDKVLPHLQFGVPLEGAEGIKTHWRRPTLLMLAMTLHNIPEGLALGIAFGAASTQQAAASLPAAVALAIGIGIQDIPEGLAVSVPMRRDKMSAIKSFWYGLLSGATEPLAALFGALAVIMTRQILPFTLAFAAGAMFFIVVEELIPESQRGGHAALATVGSIIGFIVMMILDVGLG
jgi:ZIP family zinc transporter